MTYSNIKIVKERLVFIETLNKSREFFRGNDLIETNENDNTWSHPYRHFAALRYYLFLTCFDILGQTKNHIDFNSWLESKQHNSERDKILYEIGNQDLLSSIKIIYKSYNSIYGVTNAFHRFIFNVLNEKNRNKLFESISVRKIRLEDNKDIEYNFTEKRKVDFLFLIRNSFTHKGKSFASGSAGVKFKIDLEESFQDPFTKKTAWIWQVIYVEENNDFKYMYSVIRWPYLLKEIIEDTINNSD